MDTNSFALGADLLTFQNPSGPVAVTGFRWHDPTTLVITFADQPADVPLFMALSPTILNSTGAGLDQDGDRIPGEAIDDQYLAELNIDARGPFIFHTEPGSTASAPIDRITFHFSEPIDAGTFSLADVTTFTGPDGVDLKSQLTNFLVGDRSVTVFFNEQEAGGQFTIAIGPSIADAAGNLMDQSRDGVNGQTDDAFAFVTNVQSPDLVVASVTNPTPKTHGDDVTLTWTVQNNGDDPANGTWWDYVYLSADDKWDLGDTLVGKVLYTGTELAASGGSYVGTLTAPLPGVLPGNYRVLVRSNLLENLTEATQSNNIGVSGNAARFELPALTSGVVATRNVDFREELYYKFEVPADMAGGSLILRLGTSNTGVANELYVSRNALPTRMKHDARSQQGLASNQYVILSRLKAGTYYVLGAISPDQQVGPNTPLGTANLQAELVIPGEFRVMESNFGQGGTAGNRTVEINGANFDRSLTATLTNGAGASMPAVNYYRVGPEKLYATFDLTNVAPGTYNVVLENSAGNSEVVANSMEVVQAEALASIEPIVTSPPAFRRVFHAPQVTFPVTVSWGNTSLNDAPMPVITFESNEPFWVDSTSRDLADTINTYRFAGVPAGDGPPGILLPGENGSRTFTMVPRLRREVGANQPILYYADNEISIEETPVATAIVDELIATSLLASFPPQDARNAIVTAFGDSEVDWTQSRIRALSASSTRDELRESPARYDATTTQLVLSAIGLLGNSLSGNVTRLLGLPDDEPLEVQLERADGSIADIAEVARDGSFLFASLPVGTYSVRLNGNAQLTSPSTTDVVQGANELSLTVVPFSERVVAVSDANTSLPIAEAEVIVRDQSGDVIAYGVSDASGTVHLSGAIDGVVSILVRKQGYSPHKIASTQLVDGAPLAVPLDAGLTVTGSVVDSNGETVAGAAVLLYASSSDDASQLLITDAQGRFVASSIDARVDSVIVAAPSGSVFTGSLSEQLIRSGTLPAIQLNNTPQAAASISTLSSTSSVQLQALGELPPPGPFDLIYPIIAPGTLVCDKPAGYNGLIPFSFGIPRTLLDEHEAVFTLVVNTLGRALGSQYVSVINSFLDEEAEGQRVREFGKGGDIVEGVGKFGLAANSGLRAAVDPNLDVIFQVATERIQKRLNDKEWTTKALCGGVVLDLDEIFSGEELFYIDVSYADAVRTGTLDRWEKFWALPDTIAGGLGSGGVPEDCLSKPDSRKVEGKIRIQAVADGQVSLTAQSWKITVEDYFDFIPGDIGPFIQKILATSDLEFLERYGRAKDVLVRATWENERALVGGATAPGLDLECQINPPCDDPEGFRAWLAQCCRVVKGGTADCGSFDPNDILGPNGVGAENWVKDTSSFDYTIRFENDPKEATAPAAVVRIQHTLDSELDTTSFRLGSIGFGDFRIDDAIGLSSFHTQLDLTEQFGIYLDVSAGIDASTGEAFWELRSIDPETGEVPFSPLVGFLPPNADGVEGQGYVSYSVLPKSTVQTGDVIDAVAEIIFDQNEPIETPVIFNTIDAGGPTSTVSTLPAQGVPGLTVSWNGQDDPGGSGIRYFDIYVAQDDEPFQLWLQQVTETEAAFTTALPGHSYSFYSVATDLVGFVETHPSTADAVTLIREATTPTTGTVQDGLSQRSFVDRLAIDFSQQTNLAELIASGGIVSAVTLKNLGVDADADADSAVVLAKENFQYVYDAEAGLSRLIWSFDSFSNGKSSLDDGLYELSIDASLVADAHGNPIDGNGDGLAGGSYLLRFHRLSGDANGDRTVNSADITLVNGALGSRPGVASWNANADLDRDGVVTTRDRLIVSRGTNNAIVAPATVTSLAGDYNNDGTVDAADYTVWRDNFGASGSASLAGDGDADGDVDGGDFLVWQRNFGASLPQTAASLSLAYVGSSAEVVASSAGTPELANLIAADGAVNADERGALVDLALAENLFSANALQNGTERRTIRANSRPIARPSFLRDPQAGDFSVASRTRLEPMSRSGTPAESVHGVLKDDPATEFDLAFAELFEEVDSESTIAHKASRLRGRLAKVKST
ncbi:MAG: Ig-like domain-containing protein [Planctomycetaceae bacterium]|nr:Ig-like domain-containing protein [Planctomycetaceae bacterium]